MPSLTDIADADLEWMVEDSGEWVIYTPAATGVPLQLAVIIDRNAQQTPAYGYENALSKRHHEITFPQTALAFEPVRGDIVEWGGSRYTVDNASPNDDHTWTLAVR